MYAKCALILLGVVAAVIVVEWRMRRAPALVIQPPAAGRSTDIPELDRVITDLDLRKVPLKEVLHALAVHTHTNIVPDWKWADDEVTPDVPVSIRLKGVSLATALRVIDDLVFGDAKDKRTLDYGIEPGGIIVIGSVPTDDRNCDLAPVMESMDVNDFLRAENQERGADRAPRYPMLWLFRVPEKYPFYEFLQSAIPGYFSATIFGNRLVMYDTPQRERQVRNLIEALRHPIDPMQPLPIVATRPVRRLARLKLDNVPVDEAFERWREAVGPNAGFMLPRERGHGNENFHYDLRAPVTVDLSDVSAEDAVAEIIDKCTGYLGSMSVYHDDGIMYVRPTGIRPPGVLRVFNVSQLIAHPERWYRDGYNPARPQAEVPEEDVEKALAVVLDDYDGKYSYWQGRLVIFGKPEELEKKARRLRAMLSQKSPDDYKPDPEPTGNP